MIYSLYLFLEKKCFKANIYVPKLCDLCRNIVLCNFLKVQFYLLYNIPFKLHPFKADFLLMKHVFIPLSFCLEKDFLKLSACNIYGKCLYIYYYNLIFIL